MVSGQKGKPMTKKRAVTTDEQQIEILRVAAQKRRKEIAAEEWAIDDMIQQSLRLHGP